MQNLPKELQKEIDCTHRTNKQADVQVVQFSSSIIKQKKGTLPLIFPEKKPWLTITRTMPFWFEPVHGKTLAEFSDSCESVLFLWRSASRRYELLLPLVNSTTRSYLVRIQGQLMLKVITDRKTKASSQPHLIMASGSDPFQLVHSAMQVASSELKTFRLREEKNTPKFIEGLGWCTWDAFYQEVNARGILRGLQSFKKGKLSPRFLIIDDGWQATKQFRVQGFAATSRKFPQGLSDVVEKAKHTYGVQMVGVWHTLQGYWQGTSADGPLKKFYQIVRNSKKSSKFEGWPDQFDADTRDLVHPTDIQRFYQDFYRYLRSCGIDMTKVDNQAMLQDFTEGILPQVQTQVSYQEALQGASAHHFNGNLLHCMCNTSDIGFHMSSANLWRNSDDFYPKKNSDAQARHIHSNAFNNVFSQTFSIPDWDMFQTYHATGAYHAAARSISGGPIYVSDKPGKQNFALLKKLCLDDGRVLRCPQPALPSEDRLFTNCLKESKLLKITNRNGDHGVLGLFHCQNKEFRSTESITNTFAPSDIPYLRGKEFACFLHNQDEYICLSTRTKKSLTLNPLEFELATFAPIEQGVAVFGLLDKYNSSAAILQSGWQSSQEYSIQLIAGGEIGIYSEMRPKSIRANGRPIKFKYNKKQRRLTIRKRTPKTLTIQMRF